MGAGQQAGSSSPPPTRPSTAATKAEQEKRHWRLRTPIDLANGGKLEIFTPDYFFLARKPLNAVNKAVKKSSK